VNQGCEHAERACLPCKLEGWRDGSSSLGVAIPEWWKGPSKWELDRRQRAEMDAAGMSYDRAPK
jgi:hypothetical protein